jgi:hypothetical protein
VSFALGLPTSFAAAYQIRDKIGSGGGSQMISPKVRGLNSVQEKAGLVARPMLKYQYRQLLHHLNHRVCLRIDDDALIVDDRVSVSGIFGDWRQDDFARKRFTDHDGLLDHD